MRSLDLRPHELSGSAAPRPGMPPRPDQPDPAATRWGWVGRRLHGVPVMWLLGLGMVLLGAGVGAIFPAFAVALGVPPGYVHTLVFRAACLVAGLSLAGFNWCLVRWIVGRRLRRLSTALTEVADQVVRASGAQEGAVGSVAGKLPPGASDHLGTAARAFNDLLDSLNRERRFRTVIHASSDVTVMVDADGAVVFASTSVRHVLGWDPDAVIGARLLDAVDPQDRDRVRLLLERPAPSSSAAGDAGDAAAPVTVRVAAADGSSRSLELAVSDHRGDPVIAALVLTGRDVSERVRLQTELSHQAVHDVLTGLPNRAALLQRAIELHSSSEQLPLAIALMDLDRFKEINDTLGHGYGDKLLAEVGPRLHAQMRPGDLLVRLGGDEFAILMIDLSPEAAVAVAGRARASLQRPFEIDGLLLEVDASVGVATSTPAADGRTAGADVLDLLRMADVAMYTAKDLQTGVERYDPRSDVNDRSRLTLLTDFRRALVRGELLLHYQPKLDLVDGSLAGVEALVRWQHPTRGLLLPGDFLPTVEHTGLIWPLTLEVLDQALDQVHAWDTAGHEVQVAVNLSARCLHRHDLVSQVLERLSAHHVPARLLRLELTESALMSDPDRALQHLRQLAEAGVRLSIDDFGTGYSSMSYLRRLPVDELKVDRSFVADIAALPTDDVLIRSIVELAHSLGLTVVAEGVEEASTHTTLQGLRCDIGQGYHYARPQPAEHLSHWLSPRDREAVVQD